MIAFHIIHKAPEAHQCLFHLLMAIVPIFLAWPDVRDPAIGQFFSCVVEAKVLAVSQRVVINGRLDEVSGDVPFVVTAMIG